MIDRRLERWFVRFRERGDAAALTRIFDRVAPDLLALASHLVREPNAAEDLVQTTFLKAIEHADRFDAERRLYPWLVGILTRETRNWQRLAARTIAAEELGTGHVAEASRAAQAAELSAALDAAIGELPGSYRDIVRAYLEDGRKPREIAAQHGLAPGTVRVRIHRGLDRLRKRLPAGFALGTIAAFTPTRGLAAVRARVLAAAHTVPEAASVATASTFGLAWIGAGSALALLAALTLRSFHVEPAPEDALRPASAVALAVLEAETGIERPVSAEHLRTVAAQLEKLPSAADEPSSRVAALAQELSVDDEADEEPKVWIRGRAFVPAGYSQEDVVVAVYETYRPGPAEDPFRFALAQRLYADIEMSAPCDEDGAFELEVEAADSGRLVVYADNLLPCTLDLDLANDVDVGEVSLEEGCAIEGRAFFAGEPLGASGRVFATPLEPSSISAGDLQKLDVDGRPYAHRVAEVETDSEGRFRITGLHPVPYDVTAVPHAVGGRGHHYETMPGDGTPIRAPASGVSLGSALLPVTVRVVSEGAPVRNATVVPRDADGRSFEQEPMRWLFPGQSGARADSDGCARLFLHPRLPMNLLVKAPGFADGELDVHPAKVPADRLFRVELVRDGPERSLHLAFPNAQRAGVEGRRAQLQLFSFDFSFILLGPEWVERGRVRFRDPGSGRAFALLSFPLDPRRAPHDQPFVGRMKIDVRPDEEREGPIEVELDLGGRVRLLVEGYRPGEASPEFALLDADGGEVELEYLTEAPDGGTLESPGWVPGSSIWLEPVLRAGSYTLVQRNPAYGAVEVPLTVIAGQATDVVVRLHPAH